MNRFNYFSNTLAIAALVFLLVAFSTVGLAAKGAATGLLAAGATTTFAGESALVAEGGLAAEVGLVAGGDGGRSSSLL